MHRSIRTFVVSMLLSAAAIASAAPPAAPEWRTVERRAWKISMPADWKLESAIYYGEDGRRATWRFESPGRNWLLTVRVERDEARPLKDLAAWRWSQFEIESEEHEVLDEKAETIDNRELVFRISQAAAKRKNNLRGFIVLGLYTRSPSKNVLLGITLKATDKKVDGFMEVLERMLTSLDLKGLPAAPTKKGK